MTRAERPAGPFGRRRLLIAGATAALTLAGCHAAGDPDPGPSALAPTPTPSPLPGTLDAAALEQRLADYADAVLITFADRLDTAETRLLALIRDAHRAHQAVLTARDPFQLAAPSASSSASPAPSASPSASSPASPSASGSASGAAGPTVAGSVAKSIKQLRSLEAEAAAAHRKLAVDPSGPTDRLQLLALLWGSLAAAADSYGYALAAGRDPGPLPTGDQRLDYPLPTPAAAMQHVLAQIYPIVFGYQTALAKLSGARADHARASMAGYRDVRDRLVTVLTDQHQDLPAPRAAYALPVQPTSATSAGRLIAIMETAMLPHLGQWLATATERDLALQTMINTARNATAWSAKINIWPGWPTS